VEESDAATALSDWRPLKRPTSPPVGFAATLLQEGDRCVIRGS
jgi:hypothetical protein